MLQSLVKGEIKKEVFPQWAENMAYCWSWWDKIDCLMLTGRKRKLLTEVGELHFIRDSTIKKDIHLQSTRVFYYFCIQQCSKIIPSLPPAVSLEVKEANFIHQSGTNSPFSLPWTISMGPPILIGHDCNISIKHQTCAGNDCGILSN